MKISTSSPSAKGFTLLELLIVIAIIAILATIIIIVINPVEVLRRARDVQRLSDLASLKTTLALYLISVPNPDLTDDDNLSCAGSGNWSGADKVFYSFDDSTTGSSTIGIADVVPDASTNVDAVSQPEPAKIDGGGWIPIDLGQLVGSSPISNLPVDPVNTIDDIVANVADVTSDDLVYRYACRTEPLAFELNARLESILYVTEDPKMVDDGGDNSSLYEIGTRLDILGSGNQF